MHPSQLEGKKLAIWGFGREGRAALAYLRSRLPQQRISVFCNAEEAAQIAAEGDALVDCRTAPNAKDLAALEEVVKSSGISK